MQVSQARYTTILIDPFHCLDMIQSRIEISNGARGQENDREYRNQAKSKQVGDAFDFQEKLLNGGKKIYPMITSGDQQ
jgi:hypothetical protein